MSADATWRALGTTARVVVADAGALGDARAAVEAELATADRACSPVREDSELALVNAAAGEPVAVSAAFAHAVAVALRVARATDGLVDPTLGAELRANGRPRPAAAWRAVDVDELLGVVHVPRGVELDLGATAMALAVDRAARSAHARAGSGVLVTLGGDVAVAGEPPHDGWAIRVTDDRGATTARAGQTVAIDSGGVATSGRDAGRWRVRHDHILDPRTGDAATGPWRTASVAAASCVDANAASTAALVRGAGAPRWLARAGLPARLVSDDGTTVCVAGWPSDDDTPTGGAATGGRVGRVRRVAVFVPWE